MREALPAYLNQVARGRDHQAGVVAAAEAVAARPWDVVHQAGRLARCRVAIADRDLGLSALLRVTRPGSARAIVRIEKGQPYPTNDHRGRRSRGAFDTPVDLARRVVASATSACDRFAPTTGLDPACGTGAFLVAMSEAGVPDVRGTDLDPIALAVARIAAPKAHLAVGDALGPGPRVDLICGNPPFVPPERQDKAVRAALRRRFPWLHGRFDLVIPFSAVAAERVRPGGGLGLVLPAPSLVQPYGAALRRQWVAHHRITALSGPHPFPGASVQVMILVMQMDAGPAPIPAHGLPPEVLLRLDNVPFNPDLMPGDIALVEAVRAHSVCLGDLALVDTGLVAHGPGGGKGRLLFDEPGPARVPYADAKGFFTGERRWLHYLPAQMHRAKTPSMFEDPKIVLQRLRGAGRVRAAIDREGIYVGHTCTVVQPRGTSVSLERLLELIRSPIVDAVTRIERGERLDLYPKDVAAFPVPRAWCEGARVGLSEAFGLSPEQLARVAQVAAP